MTGQVKLDSYADAGILISVELVNALALPGAPSLPPQQALAALSQILADDPPSIAELSAAHVPEFLGLADRMRRVFRDLHAGDVDAAARRLNELLSKYPAHPHLAKEDGQWRLHHHPAEVALVPMWTAICAEGMARMIGTGHADRLGTCAAAGCDRVFVDVSKNASRRFCSTTCQNRVKTAAFRLRRKG